VGVVYGVISLGLGNKRLSDILDAGGIGLMGQWFH